MSSGRAPDPFTGHSGWAPETPRPIVPVPAIMENRLRGRRVLIGLPGHGWRTDLRADQKVVQGSRTYVPVIPEAEWYRAEAEQTEVFAPLVPVERVWVEDFGISGPAPSAIDITPRLVSLDEPPRREPTPALDAGLLSGRRMIEATDADGERRDLRAVTELHVNDTGDVCARVAQELDWYRWGWSGRVPRTREVAVHRLWVE